VSEQEKGEAIRLEQKAQNSFFYRWGSGNLEEAVKTSAEFGVREGGSKVFVTGVKRLSISASVVLKKRCSNVPFEDLSAGRRVGLCLLKDEETGGRTGGGKYGQIVTVGSTKNSS